VSTTFYVVIVNEATLLQINRVQELLREKAPDHWWHHFANAWIVGGDRNAAEWRELIAPALEAGPASALVLRLPDDPPERSDWAYYGTDMTERIEWLDTKLGRAPRTGASRVRPAGEPHVRKG
jgi:hypothetical protein